MVWLTMRNSVEKPSIRFSSRGSIASGVTSRPVKPVPPVVMMTSTAGSETHPFTRERNLLDVVGHDGSAGHDVAGLLDALGEHRADLSSASRRVSDTVNTAIFSAMNCLLSSIPGIWRHSLGVIVRASG